LNPALQTILYIEDDLALSRMLQKKMQRLGLSIDTALTAEDGLKAMVTKTYDLLLVDYDLPGMNGLELLALVQTHAQPAPVIILTAGGDERIALAALEMGAADYAIKDIQQTYLELLPAIMQAAFTKERLMRENARQKQELIAAKDKAEAANEAKSLFLATMSHEIRTPLNVVIGLAHILARQSLAPEQAKLVDTLGTNADLLLKLINDLLDLSRIEDAKIELETRPFDPSEIFSDIRAMFETETERKGLEFIIEDSTRGELLLGDRTRLLQVLMNLVSNALKFTDQGHIRLTAHIKDVDDKDHVGLDMSVSDTGIGIAPDKIGLIFDSFTQADQTISRRFGGSGLGLSIARSLIEMMGGEISVTSNQGSGSKDSGNKSSGNKNSGSSFHVCLTLPKVSARQLDSEMTTAKTPVTGAQNGYKSPTRRILLVEDYEPNITVAVMMLEDLGFETDVATSGLMAIDKIKAATTPYACVLMDVQMQGLDGLETTKIIRNLEKDSHTRLRIVGVTAHALAGDRERCLDVGMDDYIAKPVLPRILAAKIIAPSLV
jgi:two-component system, sensor histidine kinase